MVWLGLETKTTWLGSGKYERIILGQNNFLQSLNISNSCHVAQVMLSYIIYVRSLNKATQHRLRSTWKLPTLLYWMSWE